MRSRAPVIPISFPATPDWLRRTIGGAHALSKGRAGHGKALARHGLWRSRLTAENGTFSAVRLAATRADTCDFQSFVAPILGRYVARCRRDRACFTL